MKKIPKIIVLNLLRNPDKKQRLEEQFKKLGIDDYLFFPAVDAKYISNNVDIKIGIGYGFGRQLTKIEMAIIMGHIGILQYASANNLENVIILEDDVILCDDFIERIEGIPQKISSSWDYIYLSGHSDYVKFPEVSEEKIEHAPKMVGAFSYMVNKHAYQKIINFCLSFMTTYDDLIMQMNTLKRLESYVVFPFLAYVRDSFSENGQSITKNHSSRLYFKNKL